MRVIKTVLAHVCDDKPISEQTLRDGPLAELVMEYNSAALRQEFVRRFNFPVVNGATLGRDFKFYFSQLPGDEKMNLLNGYLERHGAPPLILRPLLNDGDEDQEMVKEERRMKHWMLKLRTYGAITLVGMFILVMGAMMVLMVQQHKLPDNAIFGTVMSTAGEIIKVLFSSK